MIKLHNTLTKKKEVLKPLDKKKVRLYACGPTVYWYAHIGNLRTYLFQDILRRVLEYKKYQVKHVINITDVGQLTSDNDTGEDKIEKGAKRDKKTAWQVARYYTEAFKKDMDRLNIKEPSIWAKATDYIPQQIELIKELEKKNYTYLISDGLYFDTSKIKDYGNLLGAKKRDVKAGARIAMVKGKKNPTDFALWKLSPKNSKKEMEWPSPWGKGFPGWHTECVAMASDLLGVPFDIHCGGSDHIQIHHPNEIAQSKALYNSNLANYWLHGEFLVVDKNKMSKSKGETITLKSLIDEKFDPLAYRYLVLTTHYRSFLNFSWQSLKSAENSLDSLRDKISEIKEKKTEIKGDSKKGKEYLKRFQDFISDDLNTAKALALLWKLLKDKDLSNREKYNLSLEFDKIFGLDLKSIKIIKIPEKIKKLAQQREIYREKKDWQKADIKRKEIESLGYYLEDTVNGFKIIKKS